MLAQVVVTSVILEGGRLLGFSSMLKYTLERYYFAQWKGEVTGIYFWVVVYKWGHFQAFLAVCTPKKTVPYWGSNSLHISLLHSCSSQSHAILPITTQLLFAAWKWKLHFDWLFSGKGMCMSIWTSCVGTGSIVWLWPKQVWRRLFYIGIIFQIFIVSIHWRKTLTNDTPLDKTGLLIFCAVAHPRISGMSAKSARNISKYMSAKHI